MPKKTLGLRKSFQSSSIFTCTIILCKEDCYRMGREGELYAVGSVTQDPL